MTAKLILVEGLPGSGKSTTATMIHEILVENNVNAELYMEGNLDHPADYEGVACFTEEEFKVLLKESVSLRKVFQERVMVRRDRYLLPYLKIKSELGEEFPEELLASISKKDIYELPLEENIAVITESWERFAQKAEAEEKVYVFECCFIQNPVTVAMIKYGASEEVSFDYVNQLAQSVKKLNPLLVYVRQEDIEKSFRKTVSERPADWFNGFVHYYTSQGYGAAKGMSGLEGTIEVLRARQELELSLIGQLDVPTVCVDNSRFEQEKHKEKLKRIIKTAQNS